MNRWTFRSYVEDGQDLIRLWYDQQPESAQAELVTMMMYLRDQPVDYWVRPEYDNLKGTLASLGELRIIIPEWEKNVHYRILGFMDESALEFTMLAPGKKTKKMRRFIYTEIGKLALNRKASVQSNRDLFSKPMEWIFDAQKI